MVKILLYFFKYSFSLFTNSINLSFGFSKKYFINLEIESSKFVLSPRPVFAKQILESSIFPLILFQNKKLKSICFFEVYRNNLDMNYESIIVLSTWVFLWFFIQTIIWFAALLFSLPFFFINSSFSTIYSNFRNFTFFIQCFWNL